jgi:hypothetical protein
MVILFVSMSMPAPASCPLDHLIIGCNEDGIEATDDDRKLFIDCRQKYRNSGEPLYKYWHYPLRRSIFSAYPYRLGEPGFDAFQAHNPNNGYTYDPNRSAAGLADEDYRLIVECVSISPGLRAKHKEYPEFTIDKVGDRFNHSHIYKLRGDPHMHLSYQAIDGDNLHWVTYCVYDEFADPNDPNHYRPSEPFTVVFNKEPLAGDLAVDAKVDGADLVRFCYYYLKMNGSVHNDYYERADGNTDGCVDLLDFALLGGSWDCFLDKMQQTN